jgi:hypothetical protein
MYRARQSFARFDGATQDAELLIDAAHRFERTRAVIVRNAGDAMVDRLIERAKEVA